MTQKSILQGAALILLACFFAAAAAPGSVKAEGAGENPVTIYEEEGVGEIQPLLTLDGIEENEGMDLEQVTETYSSEAMNEYYNSENGFRMQYPSSFSFDENAGVATAFSPDHRVRMTIESVEGSSGLTPEIISQAITLDSPEAETKEYSGSSCYRFDRKGEDGSLQIDLYVFTASWLHHIAFEISEGSEETIVPYLDYMINSISTDETDVG